MNNSYYGVVLLSLYLFIPQLLSGQSISGQLFVDYDQDGNYGAVSGGNDAVEITAPFVGGSTFANFTIQAEDSSGGTVSGTINSDGTYSIDVSGLTGDDFVVILTPPAGYTAAQAAASEAISHPLISHLQNVTTNVTGHHIGARPQTTCAANSDVYVTCYIANDRNDLTTPVDAFVRAPQDMASKALVASKADIGSAWGVAFDEWDGLVYTSAVYKSNTELGPQGLGGLYIFNELTEAAIAAVDLEAISGLGFGSMISDSDGCDTDGDGFDADVLPAGYEGDRFGAIPGSGQSTDCEAFSKAATISMGDIDVSTDGNTLFVMNLARRSVMSFDVSDATNGNVSYISELPLTNPGCAGEWRPWALTIVDGGTLFVGSVCEDASTSFVTQVTVSGSPSAATAVGANLLSVGMNYTRTCEWGFASYCTGPANSDWVPWLNTYDPTMIKHYDTTGRIGHAQPILSDIGFASDGSLQLAYLDRIGLQVLDNQNRPDGILGATVFGAGEMLRACNAGTAESPSYELEGSGSCTRINYSSAIGDPANTSSHYGPAGESEWYGLDNFSGGAQGHGETYLGSVWVGRRQLNSYFTEYDRTNGNQGALSSQSVLTGALDVWIEMYTGASPGAGLKGIGLGDIESCSLPIEIGNRVWLDLDKDGMQDADEIPIAGVKVSLLDANGDPVLDEDGNPIVATTDANGYYYFDSATGIDPDAGYQLSFDTSMSDATQYGPLSETTPNAGGDDEMDSEIVAGIINVPAQTAGTIGHTYDAGFTVPDDLGDAPDSYDTSNAEGGPSHTLDPDLGLGSTWDGETDGQPSGGADGDGADEDGVASFPTTSNGPGTPYTVTVAVTNDTGESAWLTSWIDFDNDGVFSADEAVTVEVPPGATSVDVTWIKTNDYESGSTYARFRLASDPDEVVNPNGPASSGEVEDYAIDLPLPVELISFEVSTNNGESVLSWSTASESNNAGFFVEHLAPSEEWIELGYISGGGTTSSETEYRFQIVGELLPGVHQFRLRQVDFDGTQSLSNVVILTVDLPNSVVLHSSYPNPFNPSTTVRFSVDSNQEVSLKVYDLSGRIVRVLFEGQAQVGSVNVVNFDASDLNSGTYMLRLSSRTGGSDASYVVLSK